LKGGRIGFVFLPPLPAELSAPHDRSHRIRSFSAADQSSRMSRIAQSMKRTTDARSQTATIELDSGDGWTDIGQGSLYFIGTATMLIRYAGFTILTDPNFLHQGEYARLGYGLRSRRLTDPAVHFDALPPFDMVLLSHLHEDHFDRKVEARLNRRTKIITTPHASEALARKGFSSTVGLSTWQEMRFVRRGVTLRMTSMPGRHGPGLLSALLPPVMGSMLEFIKEDQTLLRMYISGDTLLFDGLHDIRRRYAYLDQAILHLGGTRALGLLVTMDGEQGVELLRLLQPKIAIPIHYNDYTVFKSPLSDFQQRVKSAGLEDKVRYLKHGETYNFLVPVPAAMRN
jgi:L-ascorbate metabolism protein UlaG (beta-lactamase superfamily)